MVDASTTVANDMGAGDRVRGWAMESPPGVVVAVRRIQTEPLHEDLGVLFPSGEIRENIDTASLPPKWYLARTDREHVGGYREPAEEGYLHEIEVIGADNELRFRINIIADPESQSNEER